MVEVERSRQGLRVEFGSRVPMRAIVIVLGDPASDRLAGFSKTTVFIEPEQISTNLIPIAVTLAVAADAMTRRARLRHFGRVLLGSAWRQGETHKHARGPWT